jgi:hypothetical protein
VSAIARKPGIEQGNVFGASRAPCATPSTLYRKVQKTNVQTNLCDRREPANDSSLYLALLIGQSKSAHSYAFL